MISFSLNLVALHCNGNTRLFHGTRSCSTPRTFASLSSAAQVNNHLPRTTQPGFPRTLRLFPLPVGIYPSTWHCRAVSRTLPIVLWLSDTDRFGSLILFYFAICFPCVSPFSFASQMYSLGKTYVVNFEKAVITFITRNNMFFATGAVVMLFAVIDRAPVVSACNHSFSFLS